ncbi:MAG: thiamine pyrophosphate-binding protein [Proteobacteria bacterium]|nr:thiamine pyrophosphate-binding protein [Pseudomonadota bacterium]
MLGKQAILKLFEKKDIHNIFHLPGIHTLPLNESFKRHNINVFVGRHESNTAFMADGYARVSGKVGVVIVTPGPGLGNVVSGCMEAYNDDVPMLIIHIDTGRKGIGKGILHELVEPENIFKYFTKKTFSVSNKDDLIPVLNDAYQTVLSERKGPVVISVPYTFFEKEVPFRLAPSSHPLPGTRNPEPGTTINGIETVLHGKKMPIIIGGKSLMIEGIESILEEICKGASIPFLTSTSGKGIVNEDNVYAFGNIMQKGVVKDIVASSDLAIAIGTRLRDVDAKRRGVKLKELIHIDIDNQWIGKNYPATVKIAGDIKKALEALGEILKARRFEWDLKGLKIAQQKEWKTLEKSSPGFRIMRLIRDVIPENTTTVWDLSLPSYWAEYYFPVYQQNTFIMPRGISPIFYALPGGIGAKIGRPDRPCLCICGDGGVLPAISELSTMKKYNIPVVLLVYNNNSFGILEDYMSTTYHIQGSMELTNPDFIKLANAFGIKGKRAKSLNQLKRIFLHDINWDEPFLIEFNYPIFPPPWRV